MLEEAHTAVENCAAYSSFCADIAQGSVSEAETLDLSMETKDSVSVPEQERRRSRARKTTTSTICTSQRVEDAGEGEKGDQG